jgi:hypothetical protein
VNSRSSPLVGSRNVGLKDLPFCVGEIGRIAPFHALERTPLAYPLAFSNSFFTHSGEWASLYPLAPPFHLEYGAPRVRMLPALVDCIALQFVTLLWLCFVNAKR